MILCAGEKLKKFGPTVRSLLGNVEFVFANSGFEALSLAEEDPGRFDLAMFDSLLPAMDGATLCDTLRRKDEWSHRPILLFGVDDLCQKRCRSADCTEYLDIDAPVEQFESVFRELSSSIAISNTLKGTTRTVLIVDDTKEVRTVIKSLLRNQPFRTIEADSGAALTARLEREIPDIIILDVMMPGEDGLLVLQRLRADERTRKIPVIMVSGLGDVDVVSQALELGATDYLTKPICSKRFQARIKSCLDLLRLQELEAREKARLEADNSLLERRVAQQLVSLELAKRGTIFALAKLAESRDPETGEHLERLQVYCRLLCRTLIERGCYKEFLTEEYVENLVAASPLHDIGKVGIPDNILLKPGRLTKEEFEIMKSHSTIGAETLAAASDECGQNDLLEMGVEIANFHHEKWDGSGYPCGLSGTEIPLSARILALGDVYDALTSKRVYKDAFSHEKSKAIILEGRGAHFDPEVVDAFLAVEAEFQETRRLLDENLSETLVAAS